MVTTRGPAVPFVPAITPVDHAVVDGVLRYDAPDGYTLVLREVSGDVFDFAVTWQGPVRGGVILLDDASGTVRGLSEWEARQLASEYVAITGPGLPPHSPARLRMALDRMGWPIDRRARVHATGGPS